MRTNRVGSFLSALGIALIAGCAGPSLDLRRETGQVGEGDFLQAPWRSENIRNTPPGDLFAFRVGVRVDGELSPETAILEAEFAELRRFPVEPQLLGNRALEDLAQLSDLGEIELSTGSQPLKGRFVLEFECVKKSAVRTPANFPPLLSISAHMHEYWYEGNASLFAVEASADGRVVRTPPIWALPNFRTRSNWKFEKVGLRGEHVDGFDPSDPIQEEQAYAGCMDSLAFRISKEVYSKIGIECRANAVKKSGSAVLIGIGEGSERGILPGQPMFVMWSKGGLQSYIAKAIVDNTTSTSATLRVIAWNTGDGDADAMARDPSGYFDRHAGELMVRTEGLTEPPAWQERRRRVEGMEAALDGDWAWAKKISRAQQDRIRTLLEQR